MILKKAIACAIVRSGSNHRLNSFFQSDRLELPLPDLVQFQDVINQNIQLRNEVDQLRRTIIVLQWRHIAGRISDRI